MIRGTKNSIRNFFRKKKTAYENVFDSKNEFTKVVMNDLGTFCHGDRPTFNKDPMRQANREGRREVLLRIQHFLRWSNDQMYEFYNVKGE